MPPHDLLARDSVGGGSDSGAISSSELPLIIAGFSLAGAILIGLGVYLTIRYFRKKAQAKREDERGAAFLSVRGIVSEKQPASDKLGIHGNTFSRANLTPNVIMPAKTIMPPDASREEILDYYTSAGTVPRPFRPFSFALDAPLEPPSPTYSQHRSSRGGHRSSVSSFLSVTRNSFLSVTGSNRRASTASTCSSFGDSNQRRKVRQMFDPVLPDELVVSLGEGLTVVQSFDDGWCIVGRNSVFKPEEVELGAVPAWIFVKPVKGLRAERPMRTASLGVSVQLEAPPGFSSRDEVMSWSNF
ncbi:hypothetical protein JAAARDRAFT_70263 [Jaapia argillacea MUCL 33604]|uniref:SH3 domain-containing protein n=1 Tax=Jaapia argillacea MUCL 33604 TaxID=933084 RepID=A0A067PU42_9AGAM|nr:hypothetical protein JAAARDRAFT_70263 [Jaapia argillacea MUCL 33604]